MDIGCLNKRTKVFQSQEMFDTFDYFAYTDPYFFFKFKNLIAWTVSANHRNKQFCNQNASISHCIHVIYYMYYK